MSARLAIISGATGGIGRTVVEMLWNAGYALLCLGRSPTKIDALRDWFCAHPRDTARWQCSSFDVTDTTAYGTLSSLIQPFSEPPALLVICHGAAPQPCTAADAEASLRAVFETDVIGTYKLCTTVGATMCTRGIGSIVVVSSLHAKATYPSRLPYATCKAALGGMVRSLALEYGQRGVTVNSICPWQVAGDRTQRVAEREYAEAGIDTMELYRQRSPLRRLVDPKDIARTVLWLAQCQNVTGTEIIVDTGVSASMWHRPFVVE